MLYFAHNVQRGQKKRYALGFVGAETGAIVVPKNESTCKGHIVSLKVDKTGERDI